MAQCLYRILATELSGDAAGALQLAERALTQLSPTTIAADALSCIRELYCQLRLFCSLLYNGLLDEEEDFCMWATADVSDRLKCICKLFVQSHASRVVDKRLEGLNFDALLHFYLAPLYSGPHRAFANVPRTRLHGMLCELLTSTESDAPRDCYALLLSRLQKAAPEPDKRTEAASSAADEAGGEEAVIVAMTEVLLSSSSSSSSRLAVLRQLAAVAQASKPTLPPAAKAVKSTTNLVQLVVFACEKYDSPITKESVEVMWSLLESTPLNLCDLVGAEARAGVEELSNRLDAVQSALVVSELALQYTSYAPPLSLLRGSGGAARRSFVDLLQVGCLALLPPAEAPSSGAGGAGDGGEPRRLSIGQALVLRMCFEHGSRCAREGAAAGDAPWRRLCADLHELLAQRFFAELLPPWVGTVVLQSLVCFGLSSAEGRGALRLLLEDEGSADDGAVELCACLRGELLVTRECASRAVAWRAAEALNSQSGCAIAGIAEVRALLRIVPACAQTRALLREEALCHLAAAVAGVNASLGSRGPWLEVVPLQLRLLPARRVVGLFFDESLVARAGGAALCTALRQTLTGPAGAFAPEAGAPADDFSLRKSLLRSEPFFCDQLAQHIASASADSEGEEEEEPCVLMVLQASLPLLLEAGTRGELYRVGVELLPMGALPRLLPKVLSSITSIAAALDSAAALDGDSTEAEYARFLRSDLASSLLEACPEQHVHTVMHSLVHPPAPLADDSSLIAQAEEELAALLTPVLPSRQRAVVAALRLQSHFDVSSSVSCRLASLSQPSLARALLRRHVKDAQLLLEKARAAHPQPPRGAHADEELVALLMSKGFSRAGALRSAAASGHAGHAAALLYAIEHSGDADFDKPLLPAQGRAACLLVGAETAPTEAQARAALEVLGCVAAACGVPLRVKEQPMRRSPAAAAMATEPAVEASEPACQPAAVAAQVPPAVAEETESAAAGEGEDDSFVELQDPMATQLRALLRDALALTGLEVHPLDAVDAAEAAGALLDVLLALSSSAHAGALELLQQVLCELPAEQVSSVAARVAVLTDMSALVEAGDGAADCLWLLCAQHLQQSVIECAGATVSEGAVRVLSSRPRHMYLLLRRLYADAPSEDIGALELLTRLCLELLQGQSQAGGAEALLGPGSAEGVAAAVKALQDDAAVLARLARLPGSAGLSCKLLLRSERLLEWPAKPEQERRGRGRAALQEVQRHLSLQTVPAWHRALGRYLSPPAAALAVGDFYSLYALRVASECEGGSAAEDLDDAVAAMRKLKPTELLLLYKLLYGLDTSLAEETALVLLGAQSSCSSSAASSLLHRFCSFRGSSHVAALGHGKEGEERALHVAERLISFAERAELLQAATALELRVGDTGAIFNALVCSIQRPPQSLSASGSVTVAQALGRLLEESRALLRELGAGPEDLRLSDATAARSAPACAARAVLGADTGSLVHALDRAREVGELRAVAEKALAALASPASPLQSSRRIALLQELTSSLGSAEAEVASAAGELLHALRSQQLVDAFLSLLPSSISPRLVPCGSAHEGDYAWDSSERGLPEKVRLLRALGGQLLRATLDSAEAAAATDALLLLPRCWGLSRHESVSAFLSGASRVQSSEVDDMWAMLLELLVEAGRFEEAAIALCYDVNIQASAEGLYGSGATVPQERWQRVVSALPPLGRKQVQVFAGQQDACVEEMCAEAAANRLRLSYESFDGFTLLLLLRDGRALPRIARSSVPLLKQLLAFCDACTQGRLQELLRCRAAGAQQGQSVSHFFRCAVLGRPALSPAGLHFVTSPLRVVQALYFAGMHAESAYVYADLLSIPEPLVDLRALASTIGTSLLARRELPFFLRALPECAHERWWQDLDT